MSKKNPRISAGKFLSQALKELAQEVHDTDGETVKTRAECLARIVWNSALGFKEKYIDSEGNLKEKLIAPQVWAINLIFDRLEGKVPSGDEDGKSEVTLAQRVEKLNLEQFDV